MRKFILIMASLIAVTYFGSSSNGKTVSVHKETRKKIAVVDTFINKYESLQDYMCSDNDGSEVMKKVQSYHGTNIVNIIGNRINKEKYCIVVYGVKQNENGLLNLDSTTEAIKKATRNGDVIAINMSFGINTFLYDFYKELRYATDREVKIFTAAGNQGIQIGGSSGCGYFPPCFKIHNRGSKSIQKNLFIVGSLNDKDSNFGPIVDMYENGTEQGVPKMSGTSQASANAIGKYYSR